MTAAGDWQLNYPTGASMQSNVIVADFQLVSANIYHQHVVYGRGFQPLGPGPVTAHGSLGIRPHRTQKKH